MKKRFGSVAAASALALMISAGVLKAANQSGAPKSILHVVTILWKQEATDEQKTAALEGVKKMAAEIPGIKNVWIRGASVQGRGPAKDGKPGRPYDAAFVMEFEDQAALERYADHPAHRAWEKIYLPIREQSTTHDITN